VTLGQASILVFSLFFSNPAGHPLNHMGTPYSLDHTSHTGVYHTQVSTS
jgi:hypothetical protein